MKGASFFVSPLAEWKLMVAHQGERGGGGGERGRERGRGGGGRGF